MVQTMPMQPVTELAVALHALLQLLQRGAAGMRFGTLLLHVLHLGHHLAALALELRDFLLFNDEFFLRLGDALAQFSQRFLLELEFGVIGHRQRLTLLIQAVAPAGDDLQGALRVAAIGDFNL